MLSRQRVLLDFLNIANRPVHRTELTKWAFLLRHEYESAGGSAFYDFLPYKLGPFSFLLYQEIDKLAGQSYVDADGNKSWTYRGEVAHKPADVGVHRDVARIVNRFSSWSLDKLLGYVYRKHPEYTVNSEREQLATRTEVDPAVFTAGYEGESVDAFLNKLIVAGIRQLIDVRKNPIARRYGFHRSTLMRLTSNLGIDYIHFPDLGIESSLRQNLDTMADRETLFDIYERSTLANNGKTLDRVADLMLTKPSVLVCMEAEAVCCHRNHVAKQIAMRTSLGVVNL